MNYEEILNLNNKLIDSFKEQTIIKKRLQNDLNKEKNLIFSYEKEIDIYNKKKLLLVESSKEARNASKEIFEYIATNALQTILGENLSVVINFGQNKENTTAEFMIKSTYKDKEDIIVDPTNEDGGGAADIVALSSLITINSLLSDNNSAVIAIDEPTKFVSKGNSLDVAKFLKDITKDMNKQILMVTHDGVSKEIADKAYHIELDEKGISKVTNITKNNI